MTHRETDYGSEPDSNWDRSPECECECDDPSHADDECACDCGEHDDDDGWDSATEAAYDEARGK